VIINKKNNVKLITITIILKLDKSEKLSYIEHIEPEHFCGTKIDNKLANAILTNWIVANNNTFIF
jgi:hypothetical protein